MEQRTDRAVTATGPDRLGLEDVTAYEDGDAHVICEKSNARAWIRADVTTDLQG